MFQESRTGSGGHTLESHSLNCWKQSNNTDKVNRISHLQGIANKKTPETRNVTETGEVNREMFQLKNRVSNSEGEMSGHFSFTEKDLHLRSECLSDPAYKGDDNPSRPTS